MSGTIQVSGVRYQDSRRFRIVDLGLRIEERRKAQGVGRKALLPE